MSDPVNGDAIARLVRQNPAATSPVDAAKWEETKERIFRSVIATPPRVRWWKRRSFFAAVIVVGAIGASAAGYSLSRPISDPTAYSCYAQNSLTGKQALAQPMGTPRASCAAIWKRFFGPKIPSHFTLCARANGAAAVFPTGDQSICSTLGLFPGEPLDGEQNAVAQLPYVLGNELTQQSSCPTFRTVEDDARLALKRLGLRGWKLRVIQPITKEWPCGSNGVVPQTKTINIVSRMR
jgi:hypothetical protein